MLECFVKCHEKSFWDLIRIALDVEINLKRKQVFTMSILIILELTRFLHLLSVFTVYLDETILVFINNILRS